MLELRDEIVEKYITLPFEAPRFIFIGSFTRNPQSENVSEQFTIHVELTDELDHRLRIVSMTPWAELVLLAHGQRWDVPGFRAEKSRPTCSE